jgi:tetratricopeptide (TPR) repeat protein
MPEPVSLALCALKTCAAVSSMLASQFTENPPEAWTLFIEGGVKGGEAAKVFGENGRPMFAAALSGSVKRLERLYEESLRHAHSPGFRETVEVAFANFAEVIARCLPTGADLAKLDHDPEKIGEAVVKAALALRMDVFADGEARRMLTTLVSETYAELRGDAKFMEALQGVNWAEALGRLGRIEARVDLLQTNAEAERRHREKEAADAERHREQMSANEALRLEIAREKGVPPEVLQPLFEHLGMAQIPLGQLRQTAEQAIAAILAKASERVWPSNLGADIDAIIAAARAKLALLDTAGAETILDDQIAEEEATFRRRQVPLLAEKAAVQRLAYNHDGAKSTLRRLLALDPDVVWAWVALGDVGRITGASEEALRCFRTAADAARRVGGERDLSVSYDRIGDVLVRQGNLPEALKSYQAGLGIAERLSRTDAGNSDWQRDLSVSYDRIGDVLVRQGNLPEALKSYQAGLSIRERLSRTDAGNSDWQRDLSVSMNKIGDVLVSQGNLPEALKSYQAGLGIAERLSRTDAGNFGLAARSHRLLRQDRRGVSRRGERYADAGGSDRESAARRGAAGAGGWLDAGGLGAAVGGAGRGGVTRRHQPAHQGRLT